ncbi:uncharacterized protein BDZ99DRAFT_526119 [Mytilinidion resinicola]|uniref:Uncharacterized protein n=1 Tax=Mytilinidion resinicola TaxID=574789 RepID=A0A6A6Y5Y9_9PEZI|nr:uncharacterized protein BDZ99DRAFT_526119 [Mytilinidion resinicola]KAF2804080.1 hypothetical protein BDZ99DRAFT_526119 [Mytilinidion resinicola]
MDEERALRGRIRRLQGRARVLEREQDQILERLGDVWADLHEVKWEINECFRDLGEIASNRPALAPVVTPAAAVTLEAVPTPTPTARSAANRALTQDGVVSRADASVAPDIVAPAHHRRSGGRAGSIQTFESSHYSVAELRAIEPESPLADNPFLPHSSDSTGLLSRNGIMSSPKVDPQSSSDKPRAGVSASNQDMSAVIQQTGADFTSGSRGYAGPATEEEMSQLRGMKKLSKYPTVVRDHEGNWKELHCYICNGNAIKIRLSSHTTSFPKGVDEFRDHVKHIHSVSVKDEEVTTLCFLRAWSMPEVLSVFRGNVDACVVTRKEAPPHPNQLRQLLAMLTPIARNAASNDVSNANAASSSAPQLHQHTSISGPIDIPEWLGCIITCTDGSYLELRCVFCAANTTLLLSEGEPRSYFRGIMGLRYHLQKGHNYLAPKGDIANWIAKLCWKRVVPSNELWEMIAKGPRGEPGQLLPFPPPSGRKWGIED